MNQKGQKSGSGRTRKRQQLVGKRSKKQRKCDTLAQNDTLLLGLSRRQAALIAEVASGSSVQAISQRTDVSRSTLHRWLRQEQFLRALQQTRAVRMTENRDLAKAGSTAATSRVLGLLDNEDPRIVLQAARVILSEAHRAEAEESFEARLMELERVTGIRPLPIRAATEEPEREPS